MTHGWNGLYLIVERKRNGYPVYETIPQNSYEQLVKTRNNIEKVNKTCSCEMVEVI